MYKVLIVDDEPNIRAGLKVVIDWNSLGYEICGEASNGIEALDKIETLFPNVCIIDINMPIMDGLELVKAISERQLDITTIILSGYQDFSYAQKAIDYNVTSYLLKPIDEDELIKIVENAKQRFDEKQLLDKQQVKLKEISRDKFFEKLIFDDQSNEYVDLMNHNFGLNFPWTEYQLVLIDITSQDDNVKQLQALVYQVTQDEVKRMQAGFVFNLGNYVAVLINRMSFKLVQEMLNFVHGKLIKEYDIKTVIAVGGNTQNHQKLKELFNNAQKALKYKFFSRDNVILLPVEDEKADVTDHLIQVESYMKSIYIAVETFNTDKIRQIIKALMTQMHNSFMSENKIKYYVLRIYVGVVGEIIKKEKYNILDNLFDERFYNGFYSCSSIDALECYIVNKLTDFSSQIVSQNSNDMLSRLIRYININYQNDIKLEDLADTFGYNAAYLGKIFRNLTGDYFNTFVDKVRITKAKELLDTTDLKIIEIAGKTGYSNYDYFSLKFKKTVGVSPSVYRQKS